ncbi:MAG: response regulator [Zoogloea sp.]|uniref:response regulator transcription factor n=1 Tax=Zoogloea sp. TaxID=49181 RepID=UPI002628AADD|nr:response regulator [Zoogloea sp.]MDD2987706.1 response regulator [Zoogloea sp.]
MTAPLAHIVDDDEAIRDALTWLLRTRNVSARTWSSAEEFLAGWQPDFNGCIVLDIRMREMSGLECFDALLERRNPMPVIFLTGHGDVPMAVGTLKKGAFDFLEKPFDDNALVDVVIRAMESDARRLANQETQATVSGRLAQLTPREHEVMHLVLAGKFNKVIADELNISMRTVEVHRSRVFEKMGVRSAVELAQLLSPGRD